LGEILPKRKKDVLSFRKGKRAHGVAEEGWLAEKESTGGGKTDHRADPRKKKPLPMPRVKR